MIDQLKFLIQVDISWQMNISVMSRTEVWNWTSRNTQTPQHYEKEKNNKIITSVITFSKLLLVQSAGTLTCVGDSSKGQALSILDWRSSTFVELFQDGTAAAPGCRSSSISIAVWPVTHQHTTAFAGNNLLRKYNWKYYRNTELNKRTNLTIVSGFPNEIRCW